MVHINIEFKARCSKTAKIKKILISRNADYKGTDYQVDTYFKVNSGRLKIREGTIENALIYYERKDTKKPKQSKISLFPLNSNSSSSLKEILADSLGILVVVAKQREIYFIENVKFHVDSIQNLGTFIEVEAIDNEGTIGIEKLQEQCHFYLDLFGVSEKDLISSSYSDLIQYGHDGSDASQSPVSP
ncbi:MAG: class IV adenylate cyclase [Candidatus Heimdallarchaeota archaeon]|nr:MAG: class IV adenylate cyclase [Candidatus Heimdallarchaeota archaeon]